MRRFFLTFNTMLLLCVMVLPVSANMISGTDKSPNQSGPIVGTCYALSANFVASGISGNFCYGNMGSDGGVKMRTGQDGNRVVFEVLAPYVVKKFTLEAYSNNTDATITVTKVEVDGVETTFTGGSFPSKTTASNSNTSGNITVSGISATVSIAIYFDNSEVTGNSTENSGNKNKQIMAYYELEWEGDSEENIITFADSNVKALCIENWDTSGDGELSVEEAAAVTDLGTVFKGNETITSFDELQFFKGLTSIGDEAFYLCPELKSITIPTSVTKIHNLAFNGCTGLTSIIIPNSVTSIGRWAFRFCSNLSSITIPNSVTFIGESAFGGYGGLEYIMVEGNNPNYDSRDNCNAIIRKSDNKLITGCKNTVIPNSVTSIGNEAFRGCTDLTSIAIPNSVTSIDGRAFISCSNLTSIIIPNSVLSIGESAFQNCSKLTFVRMGTTNPVIIDESVFTNRANATLYVPTGSKAAYETAGVWQDFGTIIEYTGDGNIVFVDSNVKAICVENWDTSGDGELSVEEAAAVTDLGAVFRDSKITSFNELQFFTSLTSIGDNVFSYCFNLTSITIPSNVTSIGIQAFRACYSLSSITIPSNVTSISEYSFIDCRGLESISVESDNPIYDSRDNCNAIICKADNTLLIGCKTTVIPNSVTIIGNYAFYHTSLTSIAIPNSVTKISNYAFQYCSDLTSITIPNSVTSIGCWAFRSCSNLSSITISNSVLSIGESAFENCTGLTSINIPNSVLSIGEAAFSSCRGLESIIVESNNPNYDSRDNCNAIIRKSDNMLISGCKNTTVPNSVTAIGYDAFCGCTELTSIIIPNSVTSIGSYAFNGCKNLAIVKMENANPITITENVFTNRSNAILYVPYGSKAAYEAASFWQDFGTIVEHVTLDENSIAAPETANGVEVTVKRAINANEWSTICLPFAMSQAQCQAAFGSDVQIGDFTGYTYNNDEDRLTVNFSSVTTIEANHPYIIKVSTAVTEFMVDGVDIAPTAEPKVNFGTSDAPNAMIGNYVAKTKIGNGNLFLKDNNLWYSVGNTEIKAFRAYFSFADKLADFGDNYATSRIMLSFGGQTTVVSEAVYLNNKEESIKNSEMFNLNGQRVTSPRKGLYIRNGKKVFVK